MRAVLDQARRAPLRRVHAPGPGKPPWPAHPATIRALERHGLIAQDETIRRDKHGYRLEIWDCTEAGRQALEPRHVHREDRDVFMRRPGPHGGDYSTSRRDRIDDLPVLNTAHLKAYWEREAEERRIAAKTRRERARSLAQAARRKAA